MSRYEANLLAKLTMSEPFGNLTDQAKKVMEMADLEAQRYNDEYVGTERIVLAWFSRVVLTSVA